MVSVRELNKWRLMELADGDVLRLWLVARQKGNLPISLSRKEATRYIVKELYRAGHGIKEIAMILRIEEKIVKNAINATKNYSKGFRNALKVFKHPLIVYQRSEKYGYDYYISKMNAESALIDELLRGGWTISQVVHATGFNRRRVQRAAKRLREEEYGEDQ